MTSRSWRPVRLSSARAARDLPSVRRSETKMHRYPSKADCRVLRESICSRNSDNVCVKNRATMPFCRGTQHHAWFVGLDECADGWTHRVERNRSCVVRTLADRTKYAGTPLPRRSIPAFPSQPSRSPTLTSLRGRSRKATYDEASVASGRGLEAAWLFASGIVPFQHVVSPC
jgi:hypothetical protein